jgi:hypothetical protein
MFPITSFPQVVTKHAPRFRSLFANTSQWRHFQEYVTGIVVCVRLNVQSINDAHVGHRDRSNKTRFMLEADWSELQMNDERIALMLESVGTRSPKNMALVIDDTLVEKTGKKIDGVGIHLDHTTGKYVLAHNTVNSHFVCPSTHFPIDFRTYLRGEDVPKQPEHREFKTKQELAREMIRDAVDRQIPFETVLADAWYFNKDNTAFINGFNKHWIMGCKSNRIILRPNRVRIDDFARSLGPEEFEPMEIGDGDKPKTYYVCAKTVTMSEQGRLRLVICHDNPELKGEPKFFVTDHMGWDARKILSMYKMRWSIECFYRDVKQNLGYEDCEMREAKGIQRHWYLVLLAYSLLQLGAMDTTLRRWMNANTGTVGERCRFASMETLKSFILWAVKQDKDHLSPNMIMKTAFSSNQQLKLAFG